MKRTASRRAPGTKRRILLACLHSMICTFVTCGIEGCADAPPPAARIDPDSFGNDMGTLVSIADVRTVCSKMIESLNSSTRVAELRTKPPLSILIGPVRQFTTITNFDKQLFVNRLVSLLSENDLDGAYRFIQRDSVAAERQAQASGEVDGQPPPLVGAEWILSGEIREILHRAPHSGGGEEEKRTVQYSLRLTKVADGAIAWSHSHEIVKQQLIGAVYR